MILVNFAIKSILKLLKYVLNYRVKLTYCLIFLQVLGIIRGVGASDSAGASVTTISDRLRGLPANAIRWENKTNCLCCYTIWFMYFVKANVFCSLQKYLHKFFKSTIYIYILYFSNINCKHIFVCNKNYASL